MKKVKRGGITYGRSHKNGGIPVKNQSTGEMLEVEGGEGIVNKRSMASDRMVTFNGKKMTICEAVSALNQMEGGVEFSCDDVEHKQFIEEMELGGELERGKRTEKEHIETLRKLYNKRITPTQATEEVAKEHLKEDPQYYSKLAKMEAKMGDGGLIAPNGQPSNLTAEQYKLVRTPEFKDWFGDWENDLANASKVVDENGEPLVVYHGTNEDFNVFDVNTFNKNEKSGDYVGEGFYFTNQKNKAKQYGRNTKSFFLKSKNPIIVNEYSDFEKLAEHTFGFQSVGSVKVPYYYQLKKQNPAIIKEKFIELGYDGLIDNLYNQYATFEPNQIKLADGTNTTFDANNPDIRFGDGGQNVSTYDMATKMKKGGRASDNPFESMGLKKDFVGSWEDKIDYFLKKSDNFCDVEKKYCASTIDIDRADMPQIYEEYIPQYMDFLEQQGIDSRYEQGVQVGELRPTQKNISLPRMKRMLQRLLNGYYTDSEGKMLNPLKRVVIATKDGYLLDGHHRWASSLFLSPKNTVDVLRVEANIKDLVPISKNFGMVEFQKFMFGGKIKADLNEPRVDPIQPPQDPSKQTSLVVKRGGFPSKGVKIMPLYTSIVNEQGTIDSNGYTDRGITFTIGNVNLRQNRAWAVASDLQLYLEKQFPNLKITNNYSSYSGDQYIVQPIPNNIIVNADNYNFDGFVLYVRKFGKTLEISIIPTKNSMQLLEDDGFLEGIMDALNDITKYPNAVVASKAKKAKDTTILTAPAPSPRFYERNRKYRFKTLKEMDFEFGKEWRKRLQVVSNFKSSDSIADKKFDFVRGKSINLNGSQWKSFFSNDRSAFDLPKMGIPIEGKVKVQNPAFSILDITYDGYVQDPEEFKKITRYRLLTKEECIDKGLDTNNIFSAIYFIDKNKAKPLSDFLLPEMLFGREIPTAVVEWFNYLQNNGLNPRTNAEDGVLGTKWDFIKVLNLNMNSTETFYEPIKVSELFYSDGKPRQSFERMGKTFNVPIELTNLALYLGELLTPRDNNKVESVVSDSYYDNLISRVGGGQGDYRITNINTLLGLEQGENIIYGLEGASVFGADDYLLGYDTASPYLKAFTEEEESLQINPKIFSVENILTTVKEYNRMYLGAQANSMTDREILDMAQSTYFDNTTSQLSFNQESDFFGKSIPKPIFEFMRYTSLIRGNSSVDFLGTKMNQASKTTSRLSDLAYIPYDSLNFSANMSMSLDMFEVEYGAGENGEDLYKWKIDSPNLLNKEIINGTYAPKEYYQVCEFLSNGNPTWKLSESVDLEQWGNGVDKIVNAFVCTSRNRYDVAAGAFFENNWVSVNTTPKPYQFQRSVNSIDNQIEAIQTLMDSFESDETQVKGFLLKEIARLRAEREKEVLSQYYSTDMKRLLNLYASKVSLEQRVADPNQGCGLSTPSGAPSELDIIQYKIVRTEQFKNWFGDWQFAYETKNYNGVSKAINPRTGEPLVLYHGKGNMQVEASKFGFGVFPLKYFGANYTYARWFANNYNDIRVIYEFFVSVKNPMDFSAVGLEDLTGDTFKALVAALYGYEIKTPLIAPDRPLRMWQILRGNPNMLVEIRENTDYDGFIIYEDNPSDVLPSGELNSTLAYGTFKNEQSKAADGRNTTFFAQAEDFRFKRGGVTKIKA
jgi:hypothetical protein